MHRRPRALSHLSQHSTFADTLTIQQLSPDAITRTGDISRGDPAVMYESLLKSPADRGRPKCKLPLTPPRPAYKRLAITSYVVIVCRHVPTHNRPPIWAIALVKWPNHKLYFNRRSIRATPAAAAATPGWGRLDEDIIARSRAPASYANYNRTVCQPSLTNVGGRPQETLSWFVSRE